MQNAFERKEDVIAMKRKSSTSPNKGEDYKRSSDETSRAATRIKPRRVSLPSLKIAPRNNMRKICVKCRDNEYVVEPDDGFFISYCEKCDPVCLKASSKCYEKECVLLKTWNKLPCDRERIQCANKGAFTRHAKC